MSSNKPVHFMLDIETLDVRPSAVILSIGVCVVCAIPENEPVFYKEIDPVQPGRSTGMDTVYWWKQQTNCPDKGTEFIVPVLEQLLKYFDSITNRAIVWCKGTDFDISILTHAYDYYHMRKPWLYNDVRDFRTLKKLFGDNQVVTIENENPHDALADAIFQAKLLHTMGVELK